jgi:cephalosporin hydroxylase
LIIETGTSAGGSALFLADMCKLFGCGEVVTIDIRDCKYEKDLNNFRDSNITFIIGSSTSQDVYEKVKEIAAKKKSVMVVLDALHTKEHVLNEMELYGQLVTKGNYMIVEDTNFNGHPIVVPHSNYEGPWEAVETYFQKHSDFIMDKSKETHLMTFNPGGYLKKII